MGTILHFLQRMFSESNRRRLPATSFETTLHDVLRLLERERASRSFHRALLDKCEWKPRCTGRPLARQVTMQPHDTNHRERTKLAPLVFPMWGKL